VDWWDGEVYTESLLHHKRVEIHHSGVDRIQYHCKRVEAYTRGTVATQEQVEHLGCEYQNSLIIRGIVDEWHDLFVRR